MRKTIKIAVIEDNDFDYELVERKLKLLELPHEIRRAMDEKGFTELLKDQSPDLILSDFSLPSFSGLEALKIAKSTCPLTPFIFVSGTIGEELAVETMKQGAVDYVLKDNLNKLLPAIIRALNEAEEKNKRQEAEKKLLAKNKELRSLVYRISHDIRGPLCTIKGAINLIWGLKKNKDKAGNSYFDYVKLIEEVVGKLDGIVLNLGSFNYIYGDEVKAHTIKLSIFLEELKTAISSIEDLKNVQLNVTVKQDKDFIGEPKLLFSVFYNLIHNAIVFSDKSKAERIVNFTIDSSGTCIKAEIEDNGIGIEKEIQGNIFNMFYRGSSASRGAGLGLYISKTILEQLKGSIRLDSQEKIGTKVYVDIPSMRLS